MTDDVDVDVDVDLVRAELGELVDALVDARRPTQPFGVYVNRFDEPAAELGRSVERQVFLEAFANTPDQLALEYDSYEPGSVFVTVVDHRRRLPAGVMRVIVPTAAGFKSLDDVAVVWGEPVGDLLARVDGAWDLDNLWDLATLAVAADYRGQAALGLVTQGLLQVLARAAAGWRLHRFLAILDLPVLRMLQWRIGRPFTPFPGLDPRSYLGSDASLPVWGDLFAWADLLSASKPDVHALLFGGQGLEPVLSVPSVEDSVAVFESVARTAPVRRTP